MLELIRQIAAYTPLNVTANSSSRLILPPTLPLLRADALTASPALSTLWTVGVSYAYGDVVRTTLNRFYWCTTAGTAHTGKEPTGTTDAPDTTDSTGPTWYPCREQRNIVTVHNNDGSAYVCLAFGVPAVKDAGRIVLHGGDYTMGDGTLMAYQGAWYAITSTGTVTLAICEG